MGSGFVLFVPEGIGVIGLAADKRMDLRGGDGRVGIERGDRQLPPDLCEQLLPPGFIHPGQARGITRLSLETAVTFGFGFHRACGVLAKSPYPVEI